MPVWLQAAAKITDQYALAAYAIAALVAVIGVLKRGKMSGRPVLIAIVVIAVLISACLPLVAKIVEGSLYRVTVSVADQDGSPVRDCTVTTDVPSQVYRIGDSQQVEIVPAHLQNSRRVVFFASDGLGREGQSPISLGDDRTPTVHIVVIAKPSEVRGNVLDHDGNGIIGARVSIVGYSEFTFTTDGGLFVIQTHAPSGQPIYLLVEKKGFEPLRQQHLAGPAPATLTLDASPKRQSERAHQ